jgi:hypothetical protein
VTTQIVSRHAVLAERIDAQQRPEVVAQQQEREIVDQKEGRPNLGSALSASNPAAARLSMARRPASYHSAKSFFPTESADSSSRRR